MDNIEQTRLKPSTMLECVSVYGNGTCLDQCPHHSQTGEPEILEGTRFADSVEKRVEEEGNVSWREGGREGE